MTDTANPSLRERNRQLARDVVLDAAERLLRRGDRADFSMRALAAEAGVGFATPFNHFGNKNTIMQALSSRLIDRMAETFRNKTPTGDVIDRVMAMCGVAAALLLEQPEVYKVVVGSLGVVGSVPSAVMNQSRSLWLLALGDLEGIAGDVRRIAQPVLAGQLAFAFRGCLSFWIAGEMRDDELRVAVQASASAILLGFVASDHRPRLLARLRSGSTGRRTVGPLQYYVS
jgi:AcrR family transcriptional regulator